MSISFGISSSDFFSQYQEKKPLLLKKALSVACFSWRDVNEIVARSDVVSHDFKLSLGGVLPKHKYTESYLDVGTLRHRLLKPVVYDYLKNGATLIANKIKNEPLVDRYARQIAEFTGRQVISSAYVAFGSKDSFRCHWDTRDVFAIQLIGRKRWIVYEPSLAFPLYTQQSKDYEQQYPCPATPYMDFILEAGDIFYLPLGWWHNPLPLGEATFHLAVGTFPAHAMEYLSWVFRQMPEFVEARQTFGGWEEDRKKIIAVAKCLNGYITDPGNYHRFMDEFVGSTRVDSALAMEVLGNPNCSSVPDHAGIRLCASKPLAVSDRYIIANGTKLNLDNQGVQLIRCIAKHPRISLATLITKFPETDSVKLRQLVTELCRQDVLELTHY
ncbi:cupin domain-containing protein [Pseudomonas sp. LS1212]|uniref:cupin domain-containing protein n=1 Tax=Pseudomonas sp. LS1212 TaxID=2972478 RepID=UPI00215D4159|nr:cupin domain-containing protein [Pseudomonas sp. LS1212]UVJ44497.1 cupin domain-containing protein [Pseudomonas sp. LS1212]